MSDGPQPFAPMPDAPDNDQRTDAAQEQRTLTQDEIDAMRQFFALLDEWDRKKGTV